jgi:acetyl-CoA carboxylase carboxyl transferase subunit alpha
MTKEFVGFEFELPITEIESKISELKKNDNNDEKEINRLEKECEKLKREIFKSLTPIQKVQLARHPKRPYSRDYINLLFTDFIELHGDRGFADDKAIICGLGMFENHPVTIIGQQKGRTVEENMKCNFGMMHPEGYRKALRIMKLAEKFHKPIIIFIDTPGAYPGIGAEERGQAEAIARNLKEMSLLKTPIICMVISEGGSGGALGIGVANRILMLENAYYSVISPEGCAAILFHDAARATDAADALKITAEDLFKNGIIDEIIPEPLGGAHRNIDMTAENIRNTLKKHLLQLTKNVSEDTHVEMRYEKYRKIGKFKENKRNKRSQT